MIRDNTIHGELKAPLPDQRERFVTTWVEPGLAADLAQYDVRFTGVIESTFLRDLLSWVLPALIFVVSHEVIPETHRNGHQTSATIGLLGGFAVMMLLDTALG